MNKLQPQSLDLEKAILGALMLEKNAIEKVPLLKSEHFYDEANGLIYQAILDLSVDNKPIDILTVQEQLKKNRTFTKSGGFAKIAEITSKVSSSANLEYHSLIVIQKYSLREIIRVTGEAMDNSYNDSADPYEIQSKMMTELESNQFKGSGEAVTLASASVSFIKELESIQASDKLITGIDTGYHKINQITNGWHAPNLIIMAGRPGTGKTASALNFVYNIITQKIPVAFFSLEMATRELMGRLISISAGVTSEKLRNADLGETQWQSILKQNYNLPLFIDDTSGLSILEFKSKARKLVRKHGVKFIVVDYLQLMTTNLKVNREQEISFISRTLKGIAKELNVPILALAQLSRDVEKRANGRPRLSDLRESGSIEQDADIVIFLFDENADDKSARETKIEFIWAKHRNGACLSTDLLFNKPTQKFTSII
jgi:replicative DNA helicase